MQFKLRTLLVLTLLAGLTMWAYRSHHAAQRAEVEVQKLREEIRVLEESTQVDDPRMEEFLSHIPDELHGLAQMRQQALAQFDKIFQKYSEVVPGGDGILSLRSLPSLPHEDEPKATAFRLSIPATPPLWLKFGLHLAEVDPSRLDQHERFRVHEPVSASGPFEKQLPSGIQTLEIRVGPAADGRLPVDIRLSETTLLRTAFLTAGLEGASYSSVSLPKQQDLKLPGSEATPWLMSATLEGRVDDTQRDLQFSLWISPQSGEFAAFPGEVPND